MNTDIPEGIPILTGRQMRESDRRAIVETGIPGAVLMENAARGALEMLGRILGGFDGRRLVILCGKGNNGGDGLALARLAIVAGADARCILAFDPASLSADAALQRRALERVARATITTWQAFRDESHGRIDAIVDAMLGTGSYSTPGAPLDSMISWANAQKTLRFSLDIPTGLDSTRGTCSEITFAADATATMAALKPGLLLGAGPALAGRIETVHIGLPISWYYGSGLALLDASLCRSLLPAVAAGRHKFDRGKALVIGGSPGMIGAPTMAAESALTSGAGLVVLAVPGAEGESVRSGPEIMTRRLRSDSIGGCSADAIEEIRDEIGSYNAVAIGPGMSRRDQAAKFVRSVVETVAGPLVIDADGLNAFAGCAGLLVESSARIVITPHHGEMARLLDIPREEVTADPLQKARTTAAELGVMVVLKGAPTVVALPDGRAWINSAGNPGMATAGSGDVLTGTICSLIAQTGSVERGTLAGVYLHSLAGDIAAASGSRRSLRAMDIVGAIPAAYRVLERAR